MIDFKLTDEQIYWFAERMTENQKGEVIVPSYVIKKFKKIVGDEFLENWRVKDYLIQHCYV